jgi:hypothetical protein
MQFDTKATAPRVLFSPVSGVPADITDVLAVQAKKPAAENAVKLSVYQQDEGNSAAAPSAPAIVEPVVASKPKKPTQAGATDVADVLKEWTKK